MTKTQADRLAREALTPRQLRLREERFQKQQAAFLKQLASCVVAEDAVYASIPDKVKP